MAARGRSATRRRQVPRHADARRRRQRSRLGVPGRRGRSIPVSMDLLSLTPEAARTALGEWLTQRGEPAYRLRQVLPRLWQRAVARWTDATDLPAPLRAALDDAFPLPRLTLHTHQVSSDGTEKFLWALADGEAIESVLIPEGKRRTLCISSQAGCALGCVFCATGRMGFRRNLSAAALRRELMPIEKKYTLPELMAALQQFRRRVTLEYVLIGGKNDSLDTADQLARLAQPLEI